MERLRKIKISTATLGEKKANVKREVVFALLSPGTFYISRNLLIASGTPVEMIAEHRLVIQWFTHTSAAAVESISAHLRKCYTSEYAPPT
jgi:hypothetical protein